MTKKFLEVGQLSCRFEGLQVIQMLRFCGCDLLLHGSFSIFLSGSRNVGLERHATKTGFIFDKKFVWCINIRNKHNRSRNPYP